MPYTFLFLTTYFARIETSNPEADKADRPVMHRSLVILRGFS
jgi:hypothetical protein